MAKETLILCRGSGMSNEQWQNFGEVVKCNYCDCNAGMGLAGKGSCFNHGDFTDKDCKQFTDEAMWLEAWRKQEEGEL